MAQEHLPEKNGDKFDSLDDALCALNVALCDDIVGTESEIRGELARTQQNREKISRLGGNLMVLKYALGVFRAMNDPYCEAGREILLLGDDPCRLPEIMKSTLHQLKFMHSTGGLLKASMTLLPSDLHKLCEPLKAAVPELDRNSVGLGNGEALKWLETSLFPLFAEHCPSPKSSGPSFPFSNPGPF